MKNPLDDFCATARYLSKNPLGIIALFIVLVYGFACLVLGASSQLSSDDRTPIIWFVVIFPFFVLFSFSWLVSKHHWKLYGPSSFRNDSLFIEFNQNLRSLPRIETNDMISSKISSKKIQPDDWTLSRNSTYQKHRGYFLVHSLALSKDVNQKYDLFIYLLRHKSQDYTDISKVEFFFGHYWDNQIFEGSKSGSYIGVQTSAYGPFLAICRITFKDNSNVIINRYVDFEMGNVVAQLANMKRCLD